jgi:hypothetical protein
MHCWWWAGQAMGTQLMLDLQVKKLHLFVLVLHFLGHGKGALWSVVK